MAVTQSMTAHIAFATPASVGVADDGAIIVTGTGDQMRDVSVVGNEGTTTISVIYQ
jgi:hypothetical protein